MKPNELASQPKTYPLVAGQPMHKHGPRFSYLKRSFRFHKDIGVKKDAQGRTHSRGVLVNHIGSRRLELGLTQRMLAKLVGVSTRTVNRIETNYSEPRISLAYALAEALERPVEDVFEVRPLRRR